MSKVRVWMTAASVAALVGLIYAAGPGSAGDKDLAASVRKVGAAIKGGDMDGAKKMAAAILKKVEGIEDVMDLFKAKNKGGFGFGPGATDGIEKKIREVARDGAKAKDLPYFEQAAYDIAAIGVIADAHTGGLKETSKKKRKDWAKFTVDMDTAAHGLVKAAKSKAPAEIKTAASKVNNACNACHSVFRE